MTRRWIDLSHPLSHGMPRLEILPEVEIRRVLSLADGAHVTSSVLSMSLHAGTHIDAPSHALVDGVSIEGLDPSVFEGPAVVTRVRHRGAGDLITVEDVVEGGPEPRAGDMLFVDSGWGERFGTDEYRDHPSFSPELAEWIVERGITMVAVDFISPDTAFPRREDPPNLEIHRVLLGAGVVVGENLAELGQLPADRVAALVVPIIIDGADGAPARFLVDPDGEV